MKVDVLGIIVAGFSESDLVLDTGERAFVVEVDLANAFQSWKILSSLKSRTGRCPIIVANFEKDSKWKDSFTNDISTFSRNEFQDIWDDNGTYRRIKRDISPRLIIKRAEVLEIDAVLNDYSKAEEEAEWRHADVVANWHLHTETDEMFVMLSGSVTIDTENGSFKLNENDCMVVKAGTKHWARTDKTATLMTLIGETM